MIDSTMGPVVGVSRDPAHETHIELQEVHREVLQAGHRREARAEVIQGDLDAERLETLQNLGDPLRLIQDGVFGDLNAQAVAGDVVLAQTAFNELNQVAILKSAGDMLMRTIKGSSGYSICQIANWRQASAKTPAAQFGDQSRLLGHRNEF